MCFGLRARAGYRVPSGSSVGSSDETRFAAPAVPEFPEEDGEMRGMLEGRMRERGLDSPELSVVATGDELPNRETAAEAKD